MSIVRVHPDATIIVRWTDGNGLQEVSFGPDIPWEARIAVLTASNRDWGEISFKNPEMPEFLWCSAKLAHRDAARRAMGRRLDPR